MLMILLAVIVIPLSVTAWVTVKVRGRAVKAEWVAPLWGVGGTAVLAAGVLLWYAVELRTYDQCVDLATRTRGARVQNELLYDTIDDATGTTKYTAQLRVNLDVNLPILNPADCTHP